MKDQQERLKEAIQIHKQLEMLGALLIEKNRQLIKERSNAFVMEGGKSSTVILDVEKTKIKVVFSCEEGKKSGIVLEAPMGASGRGKIL